MSREERLRFFNPPESLRSQQLRQNQEVGEEGEEEEKRDPELLYAPRPNQHQNPNETPSSSEVSEDSSLSEIEEECSESSGRSSPKIEEEETKEPNLGEVYNHSPNLRHDHLGIPYVVNKDFELLERLQKMPKMIYDIEGNYWRCASEMVQRAEPGSIARH